jgi:coenzyme Q-binding protein COQ10
MKVARAEVEVDVSPERLYALITDFESYPSFVPNQSAARVLVDEPNHWQVAFELSVAKKLHYTLDLVGVPGESLRWTLIEGDMMQATDGGWTLEALGPGRTRAVYEITTVLKGFVPRSVSQALIERTLPANVNAFKLEAERRG